MSISHVLKESFVCNLKSHFPKLFTNTNVRKGIFDSLNVIKISPDLKKLSIMDIHEQKTSMRQKNPAYPD